jgi:hypothetical protein
MNICNNTLFKIIIQLKIWPQKHRIKMIIIVPFNFELIVNQQYIIVRQLSRSTESVKNSVLLSTHTILIQLLEVLKVNIRNRIQDFKHY